MYHDALRQLRWLSTARYSTAWHCTASQSTAQHGTGQHGTAQQGKGQHSMAQDSMAKHSTGWHSTTWYSVRTAWHSTAWHTKLRRDILKLKSVKTLCRFIDVVVRRLSAWFQQCIMGEPREGGLRGRAVLTAAQQASPRRYPSS